MGTGAGHIASEVKWSGDRVGEWQVLSKTWSQTQKYKCLICSVSPTRRESAIPIPEPAGVSWADLQELSEKDQTLDGAAYYTYKGPRA